MRKAIALPLVLAALALGGCSMFGGHNQPSLDEFAVARNAPLVIPPDYSLTPPVAGAISTTAESAQSQAIEALFGGPAPRSATETSMLEAAGRDRVSIGIRSTAGDPDSRVVDKGQTTLAIVNAPEGDTPTASAQ